MPCAKVKLNTVRIKYIDGFVERNGWSGFCVFLCSVKTQVGAIFALAPPLTCVASLFRLPEVAVVVHVGTQYSCLT